MATGRREPKWPRLISLFFFFPPPRRKTRIAKKKEKKKKEVESQLAVEREQILKILVKNLISWR